MSYVESLESLGYKVGSPGDDSMPDVIFVRGWGVATYFSLDDEESLDSMIDPELHAERVFAYEHPEEALEEAMEKVSKGEPLE